MSFKPGHKDYVRAMTLVRAEQRLSVAEKADIKKGGIHGYTGEKTEHLFWGEREDGLFVRATGGAAKRISARFKAAKITGQASRIDFQTTGKRGAAEDDYFDRMQQAVAARALCCGRVARLNSAAYKVGGAHSGSTFGARSSARYFRLYDKTLEQRGKVAPGLVRFEGEYKAARAVQGWDMFVSAAQPYWLAVSLMKAEFSSFGINMDWLAGSEQVEMPSAYEPSSLEKKLHWLEHHVRPSVQDLINAGRRDEILHALGLDK